MQTTKLRQFRISENLKQKDFAEITGLSIPAIHDIETGRRKPSFEILVKILEFIGKPYHKEVQELFEVFDEETQRKNDM